MRGISSSQQSITRINGYENIEQRIKCLAQGRYTVPSPILEKRGACTLVLY